MDERPRYVVTAASEERVLYDCVPAIYRQTAPDKANS